MNLGTFAVLRNPVTQPLAFAAGEGDQMGEPDATYGADVAQHSTEVGPWQVVVHGDEGVASCALDRPSPYRQDASCGDPAQLVCRVRQQAKADVVAATKSPRSATIGVTVKLQVGQQELVRRRQRIQPDLKGHRSLDLEEFGEVGLWITHRTSVPDVGGRCGVFSSWTWCWRVT